MRQTMPAIAAVCALALTLVMPGCGAKKAELFNGVDFDGWTLFIPGDSVDVNQVWSVKEGVICCTGMPNGYMRTNESFSNYELHLEWRWAGEPTNSGVLLHCQGEDRVWPNCIECQLKAGDAGDFVLIGPGAISVDGERTLNDDGFAVIGKKEQSSEKPAGQWNHYDIVCRAGSISCSVNGVLQNSGTDASNTSGPIALQSEGSAIEFRNIMITPLR